jgi:hypothetical protein
LIRQRAPFQAMTGEPTAMQLAAAVQETACSELWRGASGDRSTCQAEPVHSSTRACSAEVP